MTKVTCPKCNHTFDIDDSGSNPWSTQPAWTKYSNSHGLKCECDCCHGLSDEVYMYYDKDYYKHLYHHYLWENLFVRTVLVTSYHVDSY